MAEPGKQGEDTETLAWICAAVIALMAAGWLASSYSPAIHTAQGALAAVHVAPWAWAGRVIPILREIPFTPFGDAVEVYDFLARGGFAGMSPAQAAIVNRTAAACAFLLYAPPLLWVLLRASNVRPDRVYRNRHTLDSMIREQSRTWWSGRIAMANDFLAEEEFDLRRAADVIGRRRHAVLGTSDTVRFGALVRPAPAPVAPPPWARALRPEEWLVTAGATYDEAAYTRLVGSADRSRPLTFGTESPGAFTFEHRWEEISIASATELLSSEIGPTWTGVTAGLAPHLRGLLAIFARFYAYDLGGGDRLCQDFSAIYADICREPRGAFDRALEAEPGLMAGVDEALAGADGERLLARMAPHAYRSGAFCAALEAARKDRGVLACASFLWLRREDRRLWYTLLALGSAVAPIEGAAAIAHYRAEIQYGTRILRPAVYQASRALVEDYLDMAPERIEQRRLKASRQQTPRDRIEAIFAHPDLLQEEEEAREEAAAAAAIAAREAARKQPRAAKAPQK